MKRRHTACLFALFLLAALLAVPAGSSLAVVVVPQPADATAGAVAGQSAVEFALPTDQIIIKYKAADAATGAVVSPAAPAEMQRLSAAAGAPLTYVREMSGDSHVLALPERRPLEEVQAMADRLSALPEVEYAQPDAILVPMLTPNDPRYGEQWHYTAPGSGHYGINAPAAWDITTGSANVVVAVIDTGITNHADLSGRTVPGYDFIANVATANDGNGRDADPSDPGDWIVANECYAGSPARNSSWHGTHVAGTIGAASNNSVGVAGVNWVSKILPLRVLGKCGGFTSDIIDAMRWAAGLPVSGVPANANPARVLNLSLGGAGSCDPAEQTAINEITAAGSTVVISAGNSNANASGYRPGNCNGVVTVAATNRNGSRSYYSNYGSTVEISAPGGETESSPSNGVLSTLNSGTQGPLGDTYVYYQGTSMAAPHVAGVASLVLSRNPALTPAQVLSILQSTATVFPAGSSCNTSNCGSGIVNAGAAVAAAAPIGPLNKKVYLPLVLKTTSATAQIINGSFEAGATGWTQFSTHGWTLITQTFPGSVTPHGGAWAVWLGGDYDDISYVKQQVTVPAGLPYLGYWHWIASTDSCGFDFGGVLVNSTVVSVYDLCSSASTGGWVKRVVNLGAYVGQSVWIQIRAETDGSMNSNLFIDDVAFQASPSSATEDGAPNDDPAAVAPRVEFEAPVSGAGDAAGAQRVLGEPHIR